MEYKKKNAPDDTYTTEAPVNAGDYVMRITVESDGDYTKAVEEKEFSIRGIAMDVKVSGYQGVYDGKEHGLSITVAAPAKGY